MQTSIFSIHLPPPFDTSLGARSWLRQLVLLTSRGSSYFRTARLYLQLQGSYLDVISSLPEEALSNVEYTARRMEITYNLVHLRLRPLNEEIERLLDIILLGISLGTESWRRSTLTSGYGVTQHSNESGSIISQSQSPLPEYVEYGSTARLDAVRPPPYLENGQQFSVNHSTSGGTDIMTNPMSSTTTFQSIIASSEPNSNMPPISPPLVSRRRAARRRSGPPESWLRPSTPSNRSGRTRRPEML